MSVVTLVSGGLDSFLVACLAKEEGLTQYPLFIDYGQRARDQEFTACLRGMERLGLPAPATASLSGFGQLIRSGLTDTGQRVYEDAYTPGRNLLFLLTAAAYAAQVGADAVSIGLLHEDTSLFPDQTGGFLKSAETTLAMAVAKPVRVLAPLAAFHKRDVVRLAEEKGLSGSYSCHLGEAEPCGACIACREFIFEGEG
ncbi:7-cyano-7-deazaguanine synthase [Sphingomonas sp. FW199]|uniref:7-cyano-7-deazaguanine synthase n=1 Tax=Sphingomonas sp. FW199 TaxID=3400217 RepID=UPI003CFB256E